MDIGYAIARLTASAEALTCLLRGISAEQARWKPSDQAWSLLEVVNHLYDEEREDFRTRLQLTLAQLGQAWTPIDPERWAVERGYNQRDLEPSLENFLHERRASVAWLRSLTQPDWQASYTHPRGTIRAGDLLAAWMAHDLLHIQQIVTLQHAYLALVAAPYGTEYAGE